MKTVFFLTILSLATACDFYHDKTAGNSAPPPAPTPTAQDSATTISWNHVNHQIFTPYCVSCHSGPKPAHKIDLSNCDNVVKYIDAIKTEIFIDRSMPPLSMKELTDDQKTLLNTWIQAGHPEDEIPRPAPLPIPSASPVPETEPNYASIYKTVFAPRCEECHSGKSHEIPFDTYDKLMAVKGLIVPGHSEESDLYNYMTSSDVKKRMPEGMRRVVEQQRVDAIKTWIDTGAGPN